jgi:hypothetical protein
LLTPDGTLTLRSILTARSINLHDVHNHMKEVSRLERDACHISGLPLAGSPQAIETGVMWRRVWWSRKSMPYSGTASMPRSAGSHRR